MIARSGLGVKVAEPIWERHKALRLTRLVRGEAEHADRVVVRVDRVIAEQDHDDGGELVEALLDAELFAGDAALLKKRALKDGGGALALELNVVSDASLIGDAEVQDEATTCERVGRHLDVKIRELDDAALTAEL